MSRSKKFREADRLQREAHELAQRRTRLQLAADLLTPLDSPVAAAVLNELELTRRSADVVATAANEALIEAIFA